jgi:hypothetical protein
LSRLAKPALWALTITTLTLPTLAFAYVDPNAGGMLFQLLTPILALAAAGLAFARRQIMRAISVVIRPIRGMLGVDRASEVAEPGDHK